MSLSYLDFFHRTVRDIASVDLELCRNLLLREVFPAVMIMAAVIRVPPSHDTDTITQLQNKVQQKITKDRRVLTLRSSVMEEMR